MLTRPHNLLRTATIVQAPLLILLLILLLVLTTAQPALADPFLTSETVYVDDQSDPSQNVTHFLLRFDNGTWERTDAVSTVKVNPLSGTSDPAHKLWFDMATTPEGTHVVVAKAVNSWGESGISNPLSYRRSVPAGTGSLRFGSASER